ncbi:hypothetical protein POM88_016206 [Heracleum sosnowskyi]|uniref:Uncharacterized protein n=1 Tax=Heracleum sosnowskyi TaxID=360622 RepID=A0AAD8IMV4_9APIA|nr:hypothetical protein POM88_016206 [Heracleum sosnowskyi]
MQWYTRWDCHGEKDMPRDEVGTSSLNTNYRDDMYDAYDDDFEDCEDFKEEPNATAKEFYKMEIDEEREEKGEMPITDKEFLTRVYDPNDPAVKDLQEKMKNALSSQDDSTVELSPTDQPPSPRTQMEINRKKDVIATMQATPPKKGRIILHPHDTVGKLIGAQEAARWTSQPKLDYSHASFDLPGQFYRTMSTILDEVRKMVRSLPMREVKQSVLDQELPGGLLPLILKDSDKVIIEEEVLSEKAMEVHKAAEVDMAVEVDQAVEVDRTMDNDEDLEAEKYPLS